jgi:crossover junction endodeoxyribonuclease RuvC
VKYAGIDPGIEGGVVVFDGDLPIVARRMPVIGSGRGREVDLAAIRGILEAHSPEFVAVEISGAMPGQGVSSTFKFGWRIGELRGIVVGLHLPFVRVNSGRWSKRFLGSPQGRTRAEKKAQSRALALERWPTLSLPYKKDDGIADAAFIATFAKIEWEQEKGPA